MTPLNGRYLLFLLYFATFLAWSDESSNADYSRARRRTSFEAIKNHSETLDTRGIESGSYSLLSIDGKYNQLLVGAKDNTFLVDLENIHNFQSWNLTKSSSSSVCDKKQDDLCHNFVKIMVPFNERIFLCWTSNQMTAGCAWRNRTNLSDVPGSDRKGNVFTTVEYSSSPDQNDTAIITEQGTVFTGTINPYYGKSMIYSRSLRPRRLMTLTSLLGHGDLYTDVQFVRSFDIGHYIYFFFRERAFDCSSCGKLKISRVARICKGDYGGRFDGYFVTFQKARLICSDGADFPLNFNEIQDVWWDDEAKSFYTIFLSHPNGPPSSAICMYNLSDINQVFDESRFKSFDEQVKQWITVQNNHKEYFKDCKVNPKYIDLSRSGSVPDGMMATRKMKLRVYRQLLYHPLMEDPVQPFSFDAKSKKVSRALLIKDGVRMTGIAVDKVGAHSVVYTSTDRGSVLKISRPTRVHQPCFLNEFDIFPDDKKEVIKAITLDITRHVLYLGSDTALTKLSLEQCSSYHRHSCTSAADPYCAWDDETNRCVSILSHGDPSKLKQDLSACPKMAVEDMDWSPWKSCIQSDSSHCRYQVRPCQNKQNSSCEDGYEFQLENCTVDVSVGWEGKEAWAMCGVQHGNWSVWGTWTECLAEARSGVRQRTRTRKDPVPRRGGRRCVGESVQYEPCSLGLEVEDTEWSPWKSCIQSDSNRCRYQVRPCQNKQSSSCEGGYEFRLENCTVEDTEWSPWKSCIQSDSNRCRYQVRPCQNKQSSSCEGGYEFRLENCTVEDTEWSPWKSCIQSDSNRCRYQVRPCQNKQSSSCEGGYEFRLENCTEVKIQRANEEPKVHVSYVIGAVAGCLLTTLVFGALGYIKYRKKKHFDVPNAEEIRGVTTNAV